MTREEIESLGFVYDGDAPSSYSMEYRDGAVSFLEKTAERFKTPADMIKAALKIETFAFFTAGERSVQKKFRQLIHVREDLN